MIGLSFNPTDPTNANQNPTRPATPVSNQTTAGTNVSPLQTAIRTLSLRLPQQNFGAGAIAPAALLRSPGGIGFSAPGPGATGAPGAGAPFDLLEQLRQLFGGGAAAGAGGLSPLPVPQLGAAPPPSLTFGNPSPGPQTIAQPPQGGGFAPWLQQFHQMNPTPPTIQPQGGGMLIGPGGPR